MINKVTVLGAGSAGLLAALTLKRKLPDLQVQIVRDHGEASKPTKELAA